MILSVTRESPSSSSRVTDFTRQKHGLQQLLSQERQGSRARPAALCQDCSQGTAKHKWFMLIKKLTEGKRLLTPTRPLT